MEQIEYIPVLNDNELFEAEIIQMGAGAKINGDGLTSVELTPSKEDESVPELPDGTVTVKGLSPKKHELVSILMVAFGFVLMMNGYDTSSFIGESVLHSVHERNPQQIDKYAGYYGQTVMYATYTVTTILAPWICYRLGAKWTVFLGSLPFTIYLAAFFHVNPIFYYTSQALLGFGYGVFYSGQGQYLSEHSTRKTLSRNSVLTSAIGNQSMLLGGFLLLIINWVHPPPQAVGASTTGHSFRDFSDTEIYIIFGALIVSSISSNVLFSFLPTAQYNSLAQQEPPKKTTFINQIGLIFGTIIEPRILALLPFYIYYGMNVTFWLIVFPTSFSFSHYLAGNYFLPGLYSMSIGIGNILIGLFIQQKSKTNHSFGLVPTAMTQLPLFVIVYGLTALGTPNMSSIVPTSEPSLFIRPSTWFVVVCGVLHGMVDCCHTTMRSFISTVAVPKKRLQTYSVAKLFQSIATCIGSLLAPRLSIYGWIVLLTGLQLLATTCYCFVCRQVRREEKSNLVPKK